MTDIGMIMALLRNFPAASASQAVTAAETAVTAAASAEAHGYGITYDSTSETITVTAPEGGGSMFVVEVEGTTPSITAEANYRYICADEVSTLSFTPCAEGVCDVIFASGSTPAVLTVPNTVLWPDWFDPTALAANTIYELNVLDGVYGTVCVWT